MAAKRREAFGTMETLNSYWFKRQQNGQVPEEFFSVCDERLS